MAVQKISKSLVDKICLIPFLFEILSKILIKDELSIKTQEAAEAQGEFWDEEAWFILRGHSLFNQTTRLQLMRAILTCELSFESHRAKIFGYNFARPACEDDRDISLLSLHSGRKERMQRWSR